LGQEQTLWLRLPCRGNALKNSLVQRALKINSADVPLHPADRPLNRFNTVELHPNALTNRRPFDKFYSAAFGGRIEDTDSKGPQP
jgi:hypothetical protein